MQASSRSRPGVLITLGVCAVLAVCDLSVRLARAHSGPEYFCRSTGPHRRIT
ncbi:hypothetical protein [Rhodococcus sp. HS-D2]|uniref:hypothetical protein n=1 Tax=Rhodococcus sp. HS-D2 TaxID=1384636 RepID=UPI0012E8D623|nr:hypothetical protein [Rhodococcus sp. HS-D2]